MYNPEFKTRLNTLLIVQSNFDSFLNVNFDLENITSFRNNVQYPRHRLQLIEKTPSYMGKKLPAEYKNLIHTQAFQSKLTNVLLENYYNVNKFLSHPD